MKKLLVQQTMNREYLGEHTPTEPRYLYRVKKVVNALTPSILDSLTPSKLEKYCESDDWEVTIT